MTATAKLRFAKVYTVPDESKKPAAFALAETPYQVIDIQGAWIKIRFNNSELWAKVLDFDLSEGHSNGTVSSVKILPKKNDKITPNQKVKIEQHLTKLRVGPDDKCRILAFLFENEEYSLIEKTGKYLKISYKDTTGYILKTAIADADSPAKEKIVKVLLEKPEIKSQEDIFANIVKKRDVNLEKELKVESTRETVAYLEPTIKPPTEYQTSTFSVPEKSEKSEIVVQAAETKHIESEPITEELQEIQQPALGIAATQKSASTLNNSVSSNIIGGILLLFVLLAGSFILYLILKDHHTRRAKRKRCVIIIGNRVPIVRMSLIKRNISVEKFFKLRGYRTEHNQKIAAGGIGLFHRKADIILIDWTLRQEAKKCLQQISDAIEEGYLKYCIFYGVPPKAKKKRYAISSAFHFIGNTVKVNDLNEILKAKRTNLTLTRKEGPALSLERYSLQGEIEEDTLSEMLQFLLTTKKSGQLIVENKGPFGIINFKDGTIVHSETKESQNREAISEMLDLKKGTFRFESTSAGLRETTQIDVMNAMMEWAQSKDEKVASA